MKGNKPPPFLQGRRGLWWLPGPQAIFISAKKLRGVPDPR